MKPREAGAGLSPRRTPASSPRPLLAFHCVASGSLLPLLPCALNRGALSLPAAFCLYLWFSPIPAPCPAGFLESKGICWKRKWRCFSSTAFLFQTSDCMGLPGFLSCLGGVSSLPPHTHTHTLCGLVSLLLPLFLSPSLGEGLAWLPLHTHTPLGYSPEWALRTPGYPDPASLAPSSASFPEV